MRRLISTAFLALFVLQSSGAAAAAQAPTSVNARPLLAQAQFAFTQVLQSLQSTQIGAFLTGRESQYDAMHAPAPDFSRVRAAALRVPAHPNLHPPVIMPIFHAGTLVRPRVTDVRSLNMRALPPDPHAMSGQHAPLRKFSLPAFPALVSTPRRLSTAALAGRITPMTVVQLQAAA